jgi:hypothetical protein
LRREKKNSQLSAATPVAVDTISANIAYNIDIAG